VIGALDTCRQLGIDFVAYSPLGRGVPSDGTSISSISSI
jgi:hypothetical protein